MKSNKFIGLFLYQDGKRNVALNTRGSYSSDTRAGDSGYDIDLIYQYQTSTIPIYSQGYSLPLYLAGKSQLNLLL
ncbi:MAG: hypothetical protein HOE90_10475 [Bacteriovoracaceae bacterium]|nr:hypothetical protein [Bacteriovoracaceae bacterium]